MQCSDFSCRLMLFIVHMCVYKVYFYEIPIVDTQVLVFKSSKNVSMTFKDMFHIHVIVGLYGRFILLN